MDQGRLPENCDLYQEGGCWKLRWRDDSSDAESLGNGHWREPSQIGPTTGPGGLTEREAQRIAWKQYLSRMQQRAQAYQSTMTIASFVEKKFVPEHVATKRTSGRTHYQAILKHVITPEEVDRIFQVDTDKSKTKLRSIPGWPYLDNVRLCDTRPDNVQKLVAAAIAQGYSPQTVTHIRNVVSAIFSHAHKEQCFDDENPASPVRLPEMTRKEAHKLTSSQAREILGVMQYPEKEISLIAILTGMNVAEICGLQWRYVNLTGSELKTEGEPIPAMSIAVRTQWYRGELGQVKKSRTRNIPIPHALVPVLLGLSRRAQFTNPEDYVLVSRVGTPINQINTVARRLKPIGKELQMPWLSWHVFRRAHPTLISEFGMQFQKLHGSDDPF